MPPNKHAGCHIPVAMLIVTPCERGRKAHLPHSILRSRHHLFCHGHRHTRKSNHSVSYGEPLRHFCNRDRHFLQGARVLFVLFPSL